MNISGQNKAQNQQQARRQTKAEIVAQREQVRMLGIALGNWREAARPPVIRVYDSSGNVIETHEHAGEFKEW